MPLLVRGLRQDNTTAIKRKAAVIIENMAKLVDNPLDAVPFLPKLLPGECWRPLGAQRRLGLGSWGRGFGSSTVQPGMEL